MEKAFATFKIGGKRFLAFAHERGSVSVVGDNGENYGSWGSVERFRKCLTTGKPFEATVLGTVRLNAQIVREP